MGRRHCSRKSGFIFITELLQQHTDWETHVIAWTGELKNKVKNTVNVTADNLEDDPLYLDDEDKGEIEKKLQKQ